MTAAEQQLCAALKVADLLMVEESWPECQHLALAALAIELSRSPGAEVAELQCRQAAMWLAPHSPDAAEFYTRLADLITESEGPSVSPESPVPACPTPDPTKEPK